VKTSDGVGGGGIEMTVAAWRSMRSGKRREGDGMTRKMASKNGVNNGARTFARIFVAPAALARCRRAAAYPRLRTACARKQHRP